MPGVVLWHVEVGSDENALVFGLTVGAKVLEAYEVHGVAWCDDVL
jgi:hypothetical protein